MMETLFVIVSFFAVAVLAGLVLGELADRLRFSRTALLILAGFIVSIFAKVSSLQLGTLMLLATILGLALVMFDHASRISLKKIDTPIIRGAELAGVTFLLSIAMLALPAMILFGLSTCTALVMAALLACVSPGKRSSPVLDAESLYSVPLTIIVAFALLFFTETDSYLSLAGGILAGAAVGVVFGMLFLRYLRGAFSEQLSPPVLILSVLGAYAISGLIQGIGLVAVFVMGLMYGNYYVKGRPALTEFSAWLASSLQVMLLVLLGVVAQIPVELMFLVKALALFAVYLLARIVAIQLLFGHRTMKEKSELALAPKGLPLVAALLALTFYSATSAAVAVLTFIVIISNIIDWLFARFLSIKPTR